MIYFDNASTSFPKPQACLDFVNEYLKSYAVSPSRGSYALSNKVGSFVGKTKYELGKVLNLDSEKIFFSMNATHSLNLVIKSILTSGSHAIICSNSHNSVIRPVHFAKKNLNCSYDVFNIELDGTFDKDELQSLVNDKTKAIILNHASNVTGQLSDLSSVTQICKKNNLLLLLDATQTAGYFHKGYQDADFVIGTGHKALLGPTGIGFFYCKNPKLVTPLLQGGTGTNSFSPVHPSNLDERFEAGTPNMTSLFGLLGSLQFIQEKGLDKIREYCGKLRIKFINELKKNPSIIIHDTTSKYPKVPVVSFNIANAHPNEISELLNESSICVRSGLHCSPLTHKFLGNINGSVRASFSHFNNEIEISQFIKIIQDITYKSRFTKINL